MSYLVSNGFLGWLVSECRGSCIGESCDHWEECQAILESE